MTTYYWAGVTGAYGVAANWSPNPPYPYYPGPNGTLVPDSVVFGGTNTYTVTINGAFYSLVGFSIVDPNATIVFSGFAVPIEATAFSISAGTLDVQFGPSMPGGAIDLFGSQTFAGGTINLSGASWINFQDSNAASITTLGANITVNVLQGTDGFGYGNGYSGDKFVNQGTVNAVSANSATFGINTGEQNAGIDNQGSLNAGGNSSFSIKGYNIANSGTISVAGTSRFSAAFFNFVNDGVILVQSSVGLVASQFAQNLSASLINNGTITADGGYVDLFYAAVSGSGSIIIQNGGAVRAYGGSNLNQDINFRGAGKLTVLSSFVKNVIGFSTGDSIDYSLLSYAAGEHMVWQSTANGVQTFALESSTNYVMTTLNLKGQYSASSFQVANDGTGNVQISYAGLTSPSPVPDDFNGDGLSDILWRNTNGTVALWNSGASGAYAYAGIGALDSSWQIAGAGDFNGDGKADVLLRNSSGAVGLWDSSASGTYAYTGIGALDSTWQISGVGDFNGDGKADVLLSNSNGAVGLWVSDSSGIYTYTGVGVADSTWQIAGVGDFNGDGKADILWRNSNGAVGLWNSSPSGAYAYTGIGALDSTWQVAGVGDFNGDRKADILWRNSDGDTYLWNSDGSGGFTGEGLGVLDSSWQVAGVGDFSGDGKADILWRNSNGATYLWNSTGSGGFAGQSLGVAPTGWSIQA